MVKVLDEELAMTVPSILPPRRKVAAPRVLPEDVTTSIALSSWCPESSRSFGSRSILGSNCNMSSRGRHERVIRRVCLRQFLRANGFKDGEAHSVRPGGCIFRRESVYPIHIAAMQGDYDVVEILLEDGADPELETSRGRTVIDCALAGNVAGSNQKVVKLLQRWLK